MPQFSTSSTTLENSAGATIPRASIGRRRLSPVLGSLAFTGAFVTVIVVLATSGSNRSNPPRQQTSESGIVTEPRPGQIATTDNDASVPTAVVVPIDAVETAVEASIVDAAPHTASETVQAVAAVPNREVEFNCLRYQKKENWDALVICADQLKQLNPTLAMELKKQASMEIQSVPRIQALEAALAQKDLGQAKIELDQIWTRSSSYNRSKLKYENLEIQII